MAEVELGNPAVIYKVGTIAQNEARVQIPIAAGSNSYVVEIGCNTLKSASPKNLAAMIEAAVPDLHKGDLNTPKALAFLDSVKRQMQEALRQEQAALPKTLRPQKI